MEEIFRQGEYSFVESELTDAGCIVDLGANSGFSLRYWHELFPEARIIGVEPDANNCQACLRNLHLAGIAQQVVLVQAAVGPKRCRGRLVKTGGEWGYYAEMCADSGAGESIEVLPMEEILDAYARDKAVDLLKCDIEGGERELFRNCADWIGRVRFLVVELHPPYTIDELQKDLRSSGEEFVLRAELRRKSYPVVLLQRQPKAGKEEPMASCRTNS